VKNKVAANRAVKPYDLPEIRLGAQTIFSRPQSQRILQTLLRLRSLPYCRTPACAMMRHFPNRQFVRSLNLDSSLFAARFVIGWLLGGPGRGERKAIALVTAVRNTGVGLVIVAGNFANTAAVPSVTVFALVMTIVAILSSFPMRKL
jgi:bile acid:Na+ symporter, BASS family